MPRAICASSFSLPFNALTDDGVDRGVALNVLLFSRDELTCRAEADRVTRLLGDAELPAEESVSPKTEGALDESCGFPLRRNAMERYLARVC